MDNSDYFQTYDDNEIVYVDGIEIQIGKNCIIPSNLHVQNNNGSQLIVIGDNVHIEKDVTLRSGITIGNGSVLTIGSFVLSNVRPYTIVAGNNECVGLLEEPLQFAWKRTYNKPLIMPKRWVRTREKLSRL